MLPFLHDRLRTLDALLARSSAVLAKYNARDLDLADALTGFLDEAIAAYRTLQRPTAENRLLALKAEYVAARHGTDPTTLARVTTHRRTLERAVALRVLQASAEQVRDDVTHDRQALDGAAALLRPLVLAGIQRGVIAVPWDPSGGQAALDRLWRDLLAAPELGLAARQVALEASPFDILLLLAGLLEAAAGPAQAQASTSASASAPGVTGAAGATRTARRPTARQRPPTALPA